MKNIECPHCNELVPKTQFCIKCGKKLDNDLPSTLDQPPLIICHHCGKEVPKTNWCILCGRKMDLTSSLEVKEAPVEEKCPLCRERVPTNHNFCHLCGGKLKRKTLNDKEERVFCNRCWKPNPTDTEYCIHCGLKRQIKQSKFLEKPFEGYQLDISQFFQPVSFPLSTLQQSLTSSKNFPVQSSISHSKYFGVIKTRKASVFYKNFGGFDGNNLLHYMATFVLMLLIYTFWFSAKYAELVKSVDPIADVVFILFFGGIFLTSVLMFPIWLSTFLLYRKTGYRMNYRLDSTRVMMTVIFNFIWIFIGIGPIMLQLGSFKGTQERVLIHKSFVRGIAWGTVFSVACALFLAILNLTTVGMPGAFAGFLFQDHSLKFHLLTSFFGATWISLIILLPFGDYFDRIIRRWNQIGYLILLTIGFLLLMHSFNLMVFLTQKTYRV